MKKLLVLILGMCVLGCVPAFASISNMSSQLGTYNSTDNAYGLEVGVDNSFTFAPTGSSIKYPGTVATTNQTLTALQSGQTIVMTGSSANTRFTLPAAVVGMNYTFIDDTTNYIAVYPATGETINFASLAASAGLANSSTPAKGDNLTLFCAATGKWSVAKMRNTWVSIAP